MQKQLTLLQKYEITLVGTRGQHFLIDPNIQRKIVGLVDPKPTDTIVEIGPGLGALTEGLLLSGASVIAVESDKRFCEILKSEYGYHFKNLTVVHADILSVQLARFLPKNKSAAAKLKVAGNLPYYITSPVIFYLASQRQMIHQAVLMMQREIVDRLLAQPGTKDYGRLSLAARFYAEIHRAFHVPRTCFSPKPRVDSSVVVFTYHGKESGVNEMLLFEIIKYAFAHRRKNILNALCHEFSARFQKEEIEEAFESAGINPKKRGEELLMKDYLKLAEIFNRTKNEPASTSQNA